MLAAGLNEPEHLALDAAPPEGPYLYWGDSRRNTIEMCVLRPSAAGNCSSVQTAHTGVEVVSGLAVDPVGRALYWADGAALRVRSAPLAADGTALSAATVDVVSLVYMPAAIALDSGPEADARTQAIYYIEQRAPASVRRRALNGSSQAEVLVEYSLSRPRGLAVAAQVRRWFVVDSGMQTLSMAPIDAVNISAATLTLLLQDSAWQPRGIAVPSTLQVRQDVSLETSAAAASPRSYSLQQLRRTAPACVMATVLALWLANPFR